MSLINAISGINWLAVMVVRIAQVAIGLLWFHPLLFGKAWARLSGKDMTPAIIGSDGE